MYHDFFHKCWVLGFAGLVIRITDFDKPGCAPNTLLGSVFFCTKKKASPKPREQRGAVSIREAESPYFTTIWENLFYLFDLPLMMQIEEFPCLFLK